jgi:hypothetical protein
MHVFQKAVRPKLRISVILDNAIVFDPGTTANEFPVQIVKPDDLQERSSLN